MRRRLIVALIAALLMAGCLSRPAPPPPEPEPTPAPPVTPPAPAPEQRFDLLIRGGTVVDGSGKPGLRADVGITGGKIAAVGDLSRARAEKEINAAGLMVAPGFINPHSHTHDYINPYDDLDATASLMQGITTEIGGVDGRSPVPIESLFQRLAREGTGVNFGQFIGQGSVREQVMGSAQRAPTAAEREAMKRLVRTAMEQGAFGLSTGLEYAPGRYASTAEVVALVAETRPFGGVYSTHMRSEGAQIEEALEEALRIGKEAGVPVNLSHFKIVRFANWPKEAAVIRRIEQARAEGMQVFADVYPYLAPDYAVHRPLSEWVGSPAEHTIITAASDRTMIGRTLAQVAAAKGWPAEQAGEKLLAQDPKARVTVLVTSESALIKFLQADWSVISTDGESQPKVADPHKALQFHPRSYGTYPRLLGHYVRERQVVPVEAMVRKMSGAVADGLGLKSRGYVKPGYWADLVLFDPATVADRTAWTAPQEYPVGIRHVLVNGVVVVADGKRQPGRPGQIVRLGQS